jgi:hypothetical protein
MKLFQKSYEKTKSVDLNFVYENNKSEASAKSDAS